MSTELSNGVIIPEEYSDDWYDEMSINLRKLNDVITAASDNATDIQRLDTDKANQSDLTALTSRVSQNETDITALQTAVSGALKREIVQTLPTEDISTTTIYMIRNSESSGTNIYDEYMYINNLWELIGTSATDFSNYYTKNETDTLLSSKANDSGVMHLSGNETASGNKTFADLMTFNSVLYFTNSSVTKGTIPQNTVNPYRIYFGSGINYGASLFNIDTLVSNTGVQTLTLRSAENVVNGDDTRLGITYDPSLTQPRCIKFKGDCVPSADNTYECGTNSNKWKSINGINPGALSLPDFSNAIDISSYITVTDGSTTSNSYTPPNDGYISVNLGRSSGAIGLVISNGKIETCVRENTFPDNHRECAGFIPVQKNDTVVITSFLADSIIWAYFIPCLGNV